MRLRKEVARVATRSAVYLSLFSMICPWASLHAANLPPTRSGSDAMRPVNQDIALSSDGVLVGTIHTADGMASSGKSVVIQRDGQLIAEVKSDAEGRFIVAGLSGGVYQVDIGGQPQNYRMWTADSAPPVAQPSLIVQEGQPVVRGQMGCGGCGGFFASPWFWAGLVAVGIAVPLALDDDSDSSSLKDGS